MLCITSQMRVNIKPKMYIYSAMEKFEKFIINLSLTLKLINKKIWIFQYVSTNKHLESCML